MNDNLERVDELYAQIDKCWDEVKKIEEAVKEKLTCPHCHTNEELNVHFGKAYNYVSCLECDLRTSEFHTATEAVEQWKTICEALESEGNSETR